MKSNAQNESLLTNVRGNSKTKAMIAPIKELNRLDLEGKNRLHRAVERADLLEVKKLLDSGVSLNVKTDSAKELAKDKTALGLVTDKAARRGLSKDEIILLDSIKALLIDYGADRGAIGKLKQQEAQIAAIKNELCITEDFIARNQKLLLNREIIKECAGSDPRLTEVYQAFYNFLQSRFTMTINGLQAIASEKVVPKPSLYQELSNRILELLPYGGIIAGTYNLFSSLKEVKNFKRQASHFINNAHVDEAAADYCVRTLKYYKKEVLEVDRDIGIIAEKSADYIAGSVIALEEAKKSIISYIFGISEDELRESDERQDSEKILAHWDNIAQRSLLKFLEFIRDLTVDYDTDLGIRAAESVLPNWPERLTINSETKCFSLENAVNFAFVAHLAYESKSKIEEISRAWGFDECYVRQSDYLKSFVLYDKEKIIISFRGTYHHDVNWHRDNFGITPEDIIIRGKKLSVHSGFYNAAMKHWEHTHLNERPLKKVVEEYLTGNREAKIYVTGHSLGGAAASICYCLLLNLKIGESEIALDKINLYTFGQPMWCRSYEEAEELFDSNYYRTVNYLDFVPAAPLHLVGYKHLGQFNYLHKDNRLLDEKAYQEKAQDFYRKGNSSIGGNLLVGALFIKQHAMYNYCNKLLSILEEQKALSSGSINPLRYKLPEAGNATGVEDKQDKDDPNPGGRAKILNSKTQKLLSQGKDRDKEGNSLLHVAAAEGDKDSLAILLEKSNDCIDIKDRHGRTPLKLAVDNDNAEAATLLIRAGANLNVTSWLNEQPLLCWAAGWGYKAIVELLLNNPEVDFKALDKNGCSAFYLAVKYGHKQVVRLFLEENKHTDLEEKYESGVTALWQAVKARHAEIAEMLLDHGANPEVTDVLGEEKLLDIAAQNRDLKMIKLLILGGAGYRPADYYDMDDEGNSLLHLCCKEENFEDLYFNIVDKFQDRILTPNNNGLTAEDLALNNNRIGILEEIMQKKAKEGESLYNEEGYHLLAIDDRTKKLSKIYASVNWGISIEEARKGININKCNSKGNTILYELAAKVCDTEAELKIKLESIRQVIDYGCDINLTKRTNGFAPLHFAVSSNQLPVVEILVAKGANLFQLDSYGRIPLSIGIEYKYDNINDILTAKIDIAGLIKYYIDGAGEIEVARYLHQKDPMLINKIDEEGQTMLHLAVIYDQPELAIRILNLKPQFINKKDRYDKTPLDYAKESNNEALIEIFNANLFGKGSKVNEETDFGYHNFFNEYYSEAIEKILRFRIDEAKIDQSRLYILEARYCFNDKGTDLEKIADKVNNIVGYGDITILVPYNINNRHWVGLIFEKKEDFTQVIYIDPENKPMPPLLTEKLYSAFALINITFAGPFSYKVSRQTTNNCGPELIEDFIEYLSPGSRIPQAYTVAKHSELLEIKLLSESDRQIAGDSAEFDL